jgi:hypothetical protein
MKILSQVNQSPERDFNPGMPKFRRTLSPQSSELKVEGSSETLVATCKTERRQIPEPYNRRINYKL